jgi:hypothetical protein
MIAKGVKLLAEIAGYSLIGLGILHVLSGVNRERNIFYQALKTIAFPAIKLTRWITPRFIPDHRIGWLAFGLVLGVWLAASLYYGNLCRDAPAEIQQQLCRKD